MAKLRRLLPCILLAALAPRAHADIAPGVDWYVSNAAQVLRVHVPTLEETRARPELAQCWIVDAVLKGIETRRAIPRTGKEYSPPDPAPGASGVLVVGTREHTYPPTAASEPKWTGNAGSTDWLPIQVDQGQSVLTVPAAMAMTGKTGRGMDLTMRMDDFAKLIPADESDLQAQLLDALFFPDRFAGLAKKDPNRAAYVQMRLAISDLGRAIPALADLLESPNADLRQAAAQRLSSLTGAKVDPPAGNDAAALAAHAKAWHDWWSAHRATLIWSEATGTFAARTSAENPIADRWPELPNPLVMPPNALADALQQSMAKGAPDAPAFAAAMRAFIDGGARRDAALLAAHQQPEWRVPEGAAPPQRPAWLTDLIGRNSDLPGGLSDDPRYTPDGIVMRVLFANSVFGGSGGHLAPRLDARLMLNADAPLEIRWRVLANYVLVAHWPEFLDQRKVALDYITVSIANAMPPNYHDLLHRAVFWEPADENTSEKTISQAVFDILHQYGSDADRAFLRSLMDAAPRNALAVNAGALVLQQSGTPEDQRKLVQLFLDDPAGGAGAAVYYAAKAGQTVVIQQIIDDLKTSKGERFRRAAEALTSALVNSANPIIAGRLSDPDDFVRQWAARCLTANVTAEIEPALLAAWDKEEIPAVRLELIQALAHTRDPRALDILLAAAQEKWPEGYIYTAIAIGLRTFNDPKALPVLADLTVTYRNDRMNMQSVNEAMISFGAISGLFAVPRPAPGIWQPHNVDLQLQSAALPIIDQWRKEHAPAAPTRP